VTVRRYVQLVPIAVLVGAVACSSAAVARSGPGHNPATKKLENAFKVALYFRSVSEDGCYPAAPRLAKKITKDPRGLRVGVTNSAGSVRRSNRVFILRRGTTCTKVMMALRDSSGLYILNSALGTIRVQGQRGPRVNPGKPGPPKGVRIVSTSFKISKPDHVIRHEVLCPGKTYPIGGGMSVSPPPSPDGEGVYPHSYERLGAQRGWHINAILYDPSGASTTPRSVTVQAVCGRFLRPANPSPHATIFIRSDQVKSTTAACPKGQFLIAGGFQRTNFDSTGGNYVIESRAASPRAWRVTGSAFGGSGGGELTAIAYCVKHGGPILTEVSGSSPLAFRSLSTATTAPCPAGLTVTSTGFSSAPGTFYAGSSLNPDGTSTATAFGYFGAAPSLTAYGYCMRTRR
jgi:hypothetical protein